MGRRRVPVPDSFPPGSLRLPLPALCCLMFVFSLMLPSAVGRQRTRFDRCFYVQVSIPDHRRLVSPINLLLDLLH